MIGLAEAPALPDPLFVDVTAADALGSHTGSASHCPIALAAKRALRKAGIPLGDDDVSLTGDGTMTVWLGAWTREYDLGPAAQTYAEQFDLSQIEGWSVPVPEPRTFIGVLLPKPATALETTP